MKTWLILILLMASMGARADKLVLVAGGGSLLENVPGPAAKLNSPFGVHHDGAGNLFIVELAGNRLLRIDGRGLLWIVGGVDGKKGDSGDGGAVKEALFNGPHSVAVTPEGHVLVADTWNNRIRRVDAETQHITTLAGTGEKGYGGDGGPATSARFGGIYCASLDPRGEKLYLADLDNWRIREVNLETGRVRTVAGNGERGIPTDGAVAAEAPLVDPRAVIADVDGSVFILERSGHALRMVDSSGRIRTVAGTGRQGISGDDGDALEASMNGPKHLCFDAERNVVIADTENNVIRKFLRTEGRMIRVAGTGRLGAAGLNGPPLEAELNKPHGVYVDREGTLFIADSWNHRVLKIARE